MLEWMRLKKRTKTYVQQRSNVIQYDEMGNPLRLVIGTDGKQIWIDSVEETGDVVLIWKNATTRRQHV